MQELLLGYYCIIQVNFGEVVVGIQYNTKYSTMQEPMPGYYCIIYINEGKVVFQVTSDETTPPNTKSDQLTFT